MTTIVLSRARVPVLGRVLDEVVADGDHDVRLGEAGELVVALLQADGAERVRVGVVERALAHERLGDRDAGRARELAQRGRRTGAQDAVAREDDRPARLADQLAARSSSTRGGLGQRRRAARQGGRLQRLGHDVLGQLEVRRAGLLRLGHAERLAHDLGNDLAAAPTRAFHFVIGAMTSIRSTYWCDSLCIHSSGRCPVSATSGDAVQERVGDAGDEVQRAGPERAEADAGAAGEAPVHAGHEGAGLLVAHGHELDRRVRERVVEVERLLARDAEDVAHALGLQAAHEHVRGARTGHARRARCLGSSRTHATYPTVQRTQLAARPACPDRR